MIVYFIKNINTNLYIPEPKGKNRRGGSHLEAKVDLEYARIFRTKNSAKIFLTVWLKGKHTMDRYYDSEDGYYEENGIDVTPVPSRKREDMQIIEGKIIV